MVRPEAPKSSQSEPKGGPGISKKGANRGYFKDRGPGTVPDLVLVRFWWDFDGNFGEILVIFWSPQGTKIHEKSMRITLKLQPPRGFERSEAERGRSHQMLRETQETTRKHEKFVKIAQLTPEITKEKSKEIVWTSEGFGTHQPIAMESQRFFDICLSSSKLFSLNRASRSSCQTGLCFFSPNTCYHLLMRFKNQESLNRWTC